MSSQVQPAVPDMVESTVRTVGALAPSHRRHRAPSVDDIQKLTIAMILVVATLREECHENGGSS